MLSYTREYPEWVPYGNQGPRNHLAHKRYETRITTRDCVLALSDYPDNRYYIPMEKLIEENFERIVEITGIEPLRVFDNTAEDQEITYQIVKDILLLTQDRQILYDTTGRWWEMFAVTWRRYAELTRQHLIQLYKGIYRDQDGTSDSVGNTNGSTDATSDSKSLSKNTNDSKSTNGSVSTQDSNSDTRGANSTLPQDRVNVDLTPHNNVLSYADNTNVNLNAAESLSTNDTEGHNWGWSIAENHSIGRNKSVNRSDNSSSSHNVGFNKGVFGIYDEWVRSYRDMTGGMYYQMQKAALWSIFI